MSLLIDGCSYEAAKFAVLNWHYSGRMPMGKLVKFGAWENSEFVGTIVFSQGASRFYGVRFGLEMLEVAELARVALKPHQYPVSAMMARAIKLLGNKCPQLRLLVSFADPMQSHMGTIYQASNWVYAGRGTSDANVRRYETPDGRFWQWRHMARWLNSRGLEETVENATKYGFNPQETEPKHKYLYPLDKAMRRQIAPLAQPYPKRADD